MGHESGHEWVLLGGSNSTHKCKKCGILGHPDRYLICGTIKPPKNAPFNGDCDLLLLNSIQFS